MAEEKTQLNFNSVPKSDAARAEELFEVIGAATKAEALHAMLDALECQVNANRACAFPDFDARRQSVEAKLDQIRTMYSALGAEVADAYDVARAEVRNDIEAAYHVRDAAFKELEEVKTRLAELEPIAVEAEEAKAALAAAEQAAEEARAAQAQAEEAQEAAKLNADAAEAERAAAGFRMANALDEAKAAREELAEVKERFQCQLRDVSMAVLNAEKHAELAEQQAEAAEAAQKQAEQRAERAEAQADRHVADADARAAAEVERANAIQEQLTAALGKQAELVERATKAEAAAAAAQAEVKRLRAKPVAGERRKAE